MLCAYQVFEFYITFLLGVKLPIYSLEGVHQHHIQKDILFIELLLLMVSRRISRTLGLCLRGNGVAIKGIKLKGGIKRVSLVLVDHQICLRLYLMLIALL